MVNKDIKRVAIYARRSIYSEESESINMQLEGCRSYFKGDNYTFTEFKDEGYSGSNTNRPDFIKLIDAIQNGEFDIVICYKIDRIARNIVDFFDTYKLLEAYQVKLISMTEGFDASTPMGKLIMTILAAFAEMERSNTIQRVKDNMYTMGKMGRWTGGNCPFGYKSVEIDNGTYLEVDEENREAAIATFDKYLESESMHEVSRFLEANYKKLSVPTLSDMLRSPVYVKSSELTHSFLKTNNNVFGEPNGCGYLTYNKREKKSNGKRETKSKNMIIAVSKHEGIISDEKWLKVQEILIKRAGESKPKESAHSYLNTLVYCDVCKNKMVIDLSYITTSGERVYSFRCNGKKLKKHECTNGSIKVEFLEEDFEKKIKNLGVEKDKIHSLLKAGAKYDYRKDINSLTKTIEKNNKQIGNLVDKISLMSNEASKLLIDKIEELTVQNSELQKNLFDLESKLKSQSLNQQKVEEMIENINLFNSFEDASIEEKRNIIRKIVEKIYFNKDTNFLGVKLNKLY